MYSAQSKNEKKAEALPELTSRFLDFLLLKKLPKQNSSDAYLENGKGYGKYCLGIQIIDLSCFSPVLVVSDFF